MSACSYEEPMWQLTPNNVSRSETGETRPTQSACAPKGGKRDCASAERHLGTMRPRGHEGLTPPRSGCYGTEGLVLASPLWRQHVRITDRLWIRSWCLPFPPKKTKQKKTTTPKTKKIKIGPTQKLHATPGKIWIVDMLFATILYFCVDEHPFVLNQKKKKKKYIF